MIAQLIVGADNDIELGPGLSPAGSAGAARALQDTTDGSYPTNATITGTLYDESNVAVPNAQNITLAYVPGTTGAQTTYRGVIPWTAPLVLSKSYEFRAQVIDANNNHGSLTLLCIAVKG